MANTPHLVPIDQVGECVQQVIDDMNAKLWVMNQRGYFIEMPDELVFEMIVLKKFEAFESSDGEISETIEKQGGFSTELTKVTGSDTQITKDNKTSGSTTIHNNTGTQTDTFTQS